MAGATAVLAISPVTRDDVGRHSWRGLVSTSPAPLSLHAQNKRDRTYFRYLSMGGWSKSFISGCSIVRGHQDHAGVNTIFYFFALQMFDHRHDGQITHEQRVLHGQTLDVAVFQVAHRLGAGVEPTILTLPPALPMSRRAFVMAMVPGSETQKTPLTSLPNRFKRFCEA